MTRQAWYIFEDGKTHGPVTARELLYLVEMERLDPDALVWRPGFSEWKPAHEVEGIYKPPPLPHGPDAKPGRGPRVPPAPDFVRVISPPVRPGEDDELDNPITGRKGDRLHGPNNGRADFGTIELEAADENDLPLASGAQFGARRGARNLDRGNENAPPPTPKTATLGVLRSKRHADEEDAEAPRPKVATLGTATARPKEEASQDNEPPAPRASGQGPLDPPRPIDDAPAIELPSGPPAPPRNGLAESVAALDQTDAPVPPGQPAQATPEPEEPAGEKLEVLDRLVNRMEALETNLRDEIAKNQDLNRQINDLKTGGVDSAEKADETVQETRPGVEPAAGPSQPAPQEPPPPPLPPKLPEQVAAPEEPASEPNEEETQAPPKRAKKPALPDVEIDDIDEDFDLEVELDENYDEDLDSGDLASADWLNVAAETDSSGRSYLLRHWSGELSLGKSVWVNAVPLFVLLMALPYGLSFVDFGEGPIKLAVAIGLLVVSIPLLAWITVGVWRAAENNRAWRGGFVWPSLAQTWVLVSMLVFAGVFVTTLLPEQVSQLFSMRLDLNNVAVESDVAGEKPLDRSDRLSGAKTFDPEPRDLGNRLVESRTAAETPTDTRQLGQPATVDLQSLRARIAELKETTQKSLVQVISFNANKIPTSVGMGFYVRENLVATTYHTVQDAQALSLQNVGDKDITFSARVKAYSVELDVALVETTRKSKAIALTSPTAPQVGDGVIVLGNPRWEASAATTGSIRSAQATDGGILYVSSALVSPGSSGGPVFDHKGQLLGMARFTVQDAKPVTFVMPARVISAVSKRDMSKVTASPDSQINDSIRGTLKLTNYVKAGGSETEIISIRNETRHSLENIFFAVLYKGKGGDILYGRSLQMKGPLQPGAEESMTVRVPDLLKSYAAKGTNTTGPVMSIELVPLDFLPADFSG